MKILDFKLVKHITCLAVSALILSSALNIAYAADSQPRPEDKPYYSEYKFTKSDNYLNIGVQPNYLPAGVITAVMSRDLILRRKLQEMGITIVFYPFLTGRDVNKFFLSDDLQAGVAGEIPAITAASKKDVFIPAIMHQSPTSIVARRRVFIEELRGKRIGYSSTSTGHYALLKTLSDAGIAEKDVTLVPLSREGMVAALVNNKIFAFSDIDLTVSLALKGYPEGAVIHRSLAFCYFYFSKEYYVKHPEATRVVLAAEIKAVKWIASSGENLFLAATWTKADIQPLMEGTPDITTEQIVDIADKNIMWQSEVPVIPENSLKIEGQIALMLKFLKGFGKIDSAVSTEKIIGSFDRKLIYDVHNMPDKYNLNEFHYDVKAVR
ncbi:MAG: ABC transporter substrate-binding protein [Nitrospirae bacterium]|nr:ABC transporter substrate-binding protein [Nitrospirota bacterium]